MKDITPSLAKTYRQAFESHPHNTVLQRAVITNGIYLASRNPTIAIRDTNQWSYEIATGDIREQKKTGTCWLMATLVSAERIVGESLKVENIKLSKAYLYFYDKLEICNSFLQSVIDTKDEDLKSRHVQHILHKKQWDGGWWQEAVLLIDKYGVAPESIMPDTEDTKDSQAINAILNEKLTLYAKQLRESDDPQTLKHELMTKLYKILALSFGVPPHEFTFDFVPKKGKDEDAKKKSGKDTTSKSRKNLTTIQSTPLEFWQQYGADLSDFVTLDFRLDHKKDAWDTLYETDSVAFMYGHPEQSATTRFHPDIENAIKKQLEHDEPVWFAWDVGKQFSNKLGILDAELWKFDDIYAHTDSLNVEDRGLYSDYSGVGLHATAIVGFREENGQVTHWKVKNSWGKDRGQDGYISMHTNYLETYVLNATIRRKYLPKRIRDMYETKPVTVRYWE